MRLNKSTLLLSLLIVATLSSCSRQYAGRSYVKQKPALAKEQPRKSNRDVNAVAVKTESMIADVQFLIPQPVTEIVSANAPGKKENTKTTRGLVKNNLLAFADAPVPVIDYKPAVQTIKAADIVARPGQKSDGGKSQLTAALLAFFLGFIGIHRFYLGYTGIGIIQIVTLGGCGVWALIDFIMILTGDLQPKDGTYEKTFDDY